MLNLDYLHEKIKQEVNLYWPNFKLVAFALYDKEGVYLYNHPNFSSQNKSYSYLKWNEQFNGADTIILYGDYPTAIVNLDHYKDMESIYSIIIHELFHGFQHLQEETRFPDEMLGMNYPLLKENVELRNRERAYLYNAVISSVKEEKVKNLMSFINLRENRRVYIDRYLDYELSVETVEGPAFYVELHAYNQYSNKSYEEVLNKYSKDLKDNRESTYHLRKSCYSSGLVICLLLDELFANWKETFFDSKILLYDMLKEKVEWEFNNIHNIKISKETISIINGINEKKDEIFHQFEHENGHHLYISGDINCKAFDPMNVIVDANKQLHKNFITVSINKREYHINQPVIVHCIDKINTINKLHIVLDQKPVIQNDIIFIKGLGELHGYFYEIDGNYYINF
ncbi:hypothetical protein [Virgibacillus kimchii]